jgi:hypothetical protein
MKLTGKRFLLMLLFSPVERGPEHAPISGRTRLVKMAFLFKKELMADFRKDSELDTSDFPEFFAWKYGPFSTSLMNDLEFLINREYIAVSASTNRALPEETAEYRYWVEDLDEPGVDTYDEEVFQLTPARGLNKAMELWGELSQSQRDALKRFKTIMNRAPLSRILEYVYRKYKDEGVVDRSLIADRFLR